MSSGVKLEVMLNVVCSIKHKWLWALSVAALIALFALLALLPSSNKAELDPEHQLWTPRVTSPAGIFLDGILVILKPNTSKATVRDVAAAVGGDIVFYNETQRLALVRIPPQKDVSQLMSVIHRVEKLPDVEFAKPVVEDVPQ